MRRTTIPTPPLHATTALTAARAQTTLLGLQLDMDLAILDLYAPRTLSGGLAYKPVAGLTIAFDVNRELWSAFRLSRAKLDYSDDYYLNDTVNYRVGVEYRFRETLVFRAGYAKRPTPLGEMSGESNWIDFDRNIYTLGLSYTLLPVQGWLNSPVSFDLVGEYQKLHGRHIVKYETTEMNPNYSTGGNVWRVGLAVTVHI